MWDGTDCRGRIHLGTQAMDHTGSSRNDKCQRPLLSPKSMTKFIHFLELVLRN